MGFERFVFVQPSAYLRDNSCMLDAMRVMPGCRGIVDVDENAPDAELAQMHALGVRGVRINVSPVHPPRARPRAEAAAAHRAARGALRRDRLAARLPPARLADRGAAREDRPRCKVDCTLAHMGMFLAKDGVQQPGFQRLLELLHKQAAAG